MRVRTNCIFVVIALLIADQSCFGYSPVKPAPLKVLFTKIDATRSTGLTQNTLQLRTVAGDFAAAFPVRSDSVTIRPDVSDNYQIDGHVRRYISAKQTWKIVDSTGEGVGIENDMLRTLIIVSAVDREVFVREGGRLLVVPGHSFFLLNNPSQDAVLDMGTKPWRGYNGHYLEKLSSISVPTLIQITPNAQGITEGFPSINEGSIIDSTMDFGSQ